MDWKTRLLVSLVICSLTLTAQTRKELDIKAATVFLHGAELTSTATVALAKGENEILFTNVASNVNAASLIVNAPIGVAVEATTFQNNYLAPLSTSPAVARMNDSIERLTNDRELVANRLTNIAEQVDVLKQNRQLAGANNGLAVAELARMLDLVRTRMDTLLAQKTRSEAEQKKIDTRIARLRAQIEEEQRKRGQPGGQLLVRFFAEEAATTPILITYVVPAAGWVPIYDIMADDITGPITICYKANVYQNSGIKWDNVKLTISTGNPSEGIQAPVLAPWRLSFAPPPQPVAYGAPQPRYLGDQGSRVLTADEIKTLPTLQVTDAASLAPALYQAERGRGVNIGGARASGSLYIIDGVQVQNIGDEGTGSRHITVDNHVTVDNSGINTTFDIDLPYSVPDDGKYHLVAMKKHKIPATYRHFAVPKLDKDAFLQAEVSQWEHLDVLPGQANIFYDGTYVGQGYLDLRSVKDTVLISLGRDKKVLVKRELDKKHRSAKNVGTNVKETLAYTISVRNTRKQKIRLIVLDQLPISTEKEITVEDVSTGKGEQDAVTGILKWTLDPQPNETASMSFGYTIKYPRTRTIQ